MILYHGSKHIIHIPQFGIGKIHNDYGQGFYCTESIELAKEWACTAEQGGYANIYRLHTEELRFFSFSNNTMHVLNWLAVLIKNRTFSLTSDLAIEAREYLLQEFHPDINTYDIICGYRADDSYFSFATAFLTGGLSLGQLSSAMRLGKLGEQVVLQSKKSFDCLEFVDYEAADQTIYYPLRKQRDDQAREEFKKQRSKAKASKGTYIIDILREEWKNNDPRIQ